MGEKPKHLKFKYVYPEDLRDLYVNGLYGGVTPRNELYAHFYSERHPIPKSVIHEITPGEKLGPEVSIEKGGDVVRFVQASIAMNLDTAIAFRDWLTNNIKFMTSNIEKGKVHGSKK